MFEYGKDYTIGTITETGTIKIDGAKSLVIDSIQSPESIFHIGLAWKQSYLDTLTEEQDKEREAYKYDVSHTMWLTSFLIKDGIQSKHFSADAIGVINGDVNISGTVTREALETYNKRNSEGVFFAGSSYDLGGVTVNGNVNASLVQVGGHQAHKIDQSYMDQGKAVGGLIINGNVEADWLINDVAVPGSETYDNQTEYLEINGTAHVKQDVFNGGQAKIGKLVVDGVLYNAFGKYIERPNWPSDVTPIEGKQPPDYVAMTIGELDAKNIVNASNLFVGTLTNDRDQIYTQTYGTIRVTNNWFTDSVINMSGGVIDEASLGPDKNLGLNNVFNVTGGTLKVGDLRGNSLINLSDKGRLETQIYSVFEDYDGVANPDGLNTISLGAQMPEEVRNTITDIFTVYVPGKVIDNVMDRVTLAGGTIVISGFDVTENQRDDLTKAFKEAFFHNFQEDFSKSLAPSLRA